MADIKTKVRGTVKTIDKTVNTSARIKSNIVSTKDKLENTYNQEGENEIEYASNKITNGVTIAKDRGIYTFNKYGQKGVKETAHNIENGVERVKAFKNKVAKKKEKELLEKSAKKVGSSIKQKTITTSKKTTGKFIKTAKSTSVKSIKTTQNVAKQTERTVKAGAKVAQQTAKRIKAAAEASVKATKATIKAVISAIKMMIAALKGLIYLLIAGGWIVVVIIIVICMIGFLVSSIFGIFFSNDYDANSKSMVQVISELNTDFMNKITTIQQENPYEEYDIEGSRADWKDVLAVYVAKYSNGDYQTEMMTLDDKKIEEIKKIFWEMNEVSFTKEETTEQKTIIHLTWTEHKTITHTKLHIKINHKTAQEMADKYNFSNSQREQMNELLKDDYIAMWSSVIYGSGGNSDIVSVAESQLGNIGGQPYWSWYGFNSRVEWCATFVSWCANQCGYIENGIIPKFASCESEGNSNDSCKERNYDLNSSEIRGYGTPMY